DLDLGRSAAVVVEQKRQRLRQRERFASLRERRVPLHAVVGDRHVERGRRQRHPALDGDDDVRAVAATASGGAETDEQREVSHWSCTPIVPRVVSGPWLCERPTPRPIPAPTSTAAPTPTTTHTHLRDRGGSDGVRDDGDA